MRNKFSYSYIYRNFKLLRTLKNRITSFILPFLISIFTGYHVHAAHIVGGDVEYTCIGINSATNEVTFLIEFTMYRDAGGNGAGFDDASQTKFGIYTGDGTNWEFSSQILNIDPRDEAPIVYVPDNPCIEVPDVMVEKAVYRFNVTLPIINESYMISYQRCCRNNTIDNILNSGDTGAAFVTVISPSAQMSCNNSPKFNNFPPIIICADNPLNFDHSATDAEGDQLVYEFCAPLASGGTDGSTGGTGPGSDPNSCTGVRPDPDRCPPPYDQVVYRLPTYSANQPLTGDPDVVIDPVTGLITGVPNLNGQYVVGVCVKEFRNGVQISEIRRDFQFNVTTCDPLLTAQIQADSTVGGKEFFINSCGKTDVFFENESTKESNIDSYQWIFNINGTFDEYNTKDVTVEFPGVGQYVGLMILNPGQADCSDTANVVVNIFPSIEADFEFAYDTCIAGPVSFQDLSVTGALDVVGWDWDFAGDQGVIQNPSHQFPDPGTKPVRLISRDNNNCRDSITKNVDWFPAPPILVVDPSNFLGCAPGEIFFNNLSVPIDSTYDILWDFGDGSDIVNEVSPTHVYEETGVFSVNLDVTSPIGCNISKFFPNLITVAEKPTADFTFTPEEPNSFNKEISFFDQSIGAVSYQWNFGGVGTSMEMNPTFAFQDTGIYQVLLTVLHPSGCPDTISKLIDISPEVSLFFPNAFTPNNDAKNDVFNGIGVLTGIRNYRLSVWNRWGERVFETEDPFDAWNGQIDNIGALAMNGVYVYQAEYVGPRGDRETIKGHITLLR